MGQPGPWGGPGREARRFGLGGPGPGKGRAIGLPVGDEKGNGLGAPRKRTWPSQAPDQGRASLQDAATGAADSPGRLRTASPQVAAGLGVTALGAEIQATFASGWVDIHATDIRPFRQGRPAWRV
jgi:hypothetical protein